MSGLLLDIYELTVFLVLLFTAVGLGGGFQPGHRRGRGSSPQWKEHYSKVSEKWGAIGGRGAEQKNKILKK